MRIIAKKLGNLLCVIGVSPFALLSWLERRVNPECEVVFCFFAQFFSMMPGIPGIFLRRAYYSLTTEECSLHCNIGFGSLFTHRQVRIERGVSIGNYCVIGSVHIGQDCEIASRVSITSGKQQHRLSAEGKWTPFESSNMQRVIIGNDVWLGEGAIVLDDVGSNSLIAAGSVVSKATGPGVLAAGNPAKAIKRLQDKE